MAAEYVLIPRHKYEQLEKDANPIKDTYEALSDIDDMAMEENNKATNTTGDSNGTTPPDLSNTETNPLDE